MFRLRLSLMVVMLEVNEEGFAILMIVRLLMLPMFAYWRIEEMRGYEARCSMKWMCRGAAKSKVNVQI